MKHYQNSLSIKKANEKKLPFFEMLIIVFFLYYYLLPSAFNNISFVIMLGVGFVYILYVLLLSTTNSKVLALVFKFLGCVIFVTLCYYILTQTKTIDTAVGNYELKRFLSKFQQLFFTFLPLLFTYRVITFANKKQQALLFVFGLAMIFYVIVKTFNELSVNDTASRAWSNFTEMEEQNIGTYNFVYAVSVCIPASFALLINTKNVQKRIGIGLFLIVGFVFLVMAKYTLSLLISSALCYLAIFLGTKKKLTKVIALIITPALLMFLPYIIEFFAVSVTTGGMRTRLLEVAGYFSGESMGYNLNGRITLYKDTIKAFFDSPIIGNSSLKFDGHATFLTILSDVGLLGAIPFYWMYFSSRKHVNFILKNKTQERCFLLTFLAVILTGLVNPIHAALPLPMVAWFFVPLACTIFIK